ncbi:heavy-metal-associated domain-containing protein [Paracandidimonas soli]|uniref:Copper chaperone n=1 Tax=Paracandidimonas soli TaxID=1917182 RepID=A0A4R3VDQ2_9BURK|nr:heavy-metal-associated domain-containing protein [Paracandidimonas soli]TCV01804.1 copper chaperone [Paracandidimonas soli]
MTLKFEVQDMTCGHCVRTITEAVTAAVPGAVVSADTATHIVIVETDAASDVVEKVIREAGYTPQAR